MIQTSQQQSSRTSIHHEFNNLRGSMSSSTSSIQNNMVKKNTRIVQLFLQILISF
jgi:hypothetical protein